MRRGLLHLPLQGSPRLLHAGARRGAHVGRRLLGLVWYTGPGEAFRGFSLLRSKAPKIPKPVFGVQGLYRASPKIPLVPSRFYSLHLAGFDLDDKSNVPLGPLYESGARLCFSSSMNVISSRVVRATDTLLRFMVVLLRGTRLITNVSSCSIVEGRMPSSSIRRMIWNSRDAVVKIRDTWT